MNPRRVTVVLVTLMLVAGACSASTGIAPAPNLSDIASSTVEVPTRAPAPAPTTTPPAVSTPSPTATVAPTPTPTPIPAPTATPTPTSTPVPRIERSVDASRLEPANCPAGIDDPKITCHRAIVPLRHDDPGDGRTVDLLVAEIDNDAPAGDGPVMYLQGGPGVATVVNAEAFLGAGHDVLLFDQRGTGESTPKLACPEVDALWADPTADDETVLAAYGACADRLRADDIDLDAFHTQAVAADADVVRRLLGHDEWSIWGVSYGTRVAQTIMRDHGEDLRAAVLDAVVPFDVDFFGSIPINANRAIDALDAACEADACLVDHGDFGDTLAALVQRLNDAPVTIEATRPVTGEMIEFDVGGAEVLDLVFTQLYSTRLLRALPRQIARADYGGLDELVAGYVLRRDPNRFDLATGVYYATWCREAYPQHDPTLDDEVIEANIARYGDAFSDALAADSIGRLCESFDVTAAPAEALAPVTASIPTLVLAGSYDPITPPSWSRRVADGLPLATFVEFPDHGHGAATACSIGLRRMFLLEPAAELDLTCVADAGPPDFE